MKKNSLWKHDDTFLRVLEVNANKILVIDCIKRTMPKWVTTAAVSDYQKAEESELLSLIPAIVMDAELLDTVTKRIMHERFTMIASVLPFIGDKKLRCKLIEQVAEEKDCSQRTVSNFLCTYLVYQNMNALAPKMKSGEEFLSSDEKNMRWALNKYFYNKNKNSLTTAYTMMLKEKYCDETGTLLPQYPSIYQFRYFYNKTKNLQTFYISRNGIKDYQRNNRPLVGDGIQEFAPNVGIGMLDATVCDIYLINDTGELVGRPILVACIDAYSSICCGYSLLWEGGMYSLRNLMLNVITDKKQWCEKHGIVISADVWDSSKMPAVLVTDMGAEYKSENFEQLAELGITIVNLPAYRPELKGAVEKFFDLIQETYKKYFKGKGVIEPDFQERGAHDYRKDACLTMADFELIILRCIIYYNSQRIVENFPYTEEMFEAGIKPYANTIYEWGKEQQEANLVSFTREEIVMTLLPRTAGKFGRTGLKVNRLRYHAEGYTEQYLQGGDAVVAYNPEDVSVVWLIDNGQYIPFDLIEGRYKGKSLGKVTDLQANQKALIKGAVEENLQAQIDLAKHLQVIADRSCKARETAIKGVRDTRNREQNKAHIDFMKGGVVSE